MARKLNCKKIFKRCGCEACINALTCCCNMTLEQKMRLRVVLTSIVVLIGNVSIVILLLQVSNAARIFSLSPFILGLILLGAGHLAACVLYHQNEQKTLKYRKTTFQKAPMIRALTELLLFLRPVLFIGDMCLAEDHLERIEKLAHRQHLYSTVRMMFAFYIPVIVLFFALFEDGQASSSQMNLRSSPMVLGSLGGCLVELAAGYSVASTYWDNLYPLESARDVSWYLVRLYFYFVCEIIVKTIVPLLCFYAGFPFFIGYVGFMWLLDIFQYYFVRGGIGGDCSSDNRDMLQFTSHFFLDVFFPLGSSTSRSPFDFCRRVCPMAFEQKLPFLFSDDGVCGWDGRHFRWALVFAIRCLVYLGACVLAYLKLKDKWFLPALYVIALIAVATIVAVIIIVVQSRTYSQVYDEMIKVTTTTQSSVVSLNIPSDVASLS